MNERDEEILIGPLRRTGPGFLLLAGALLMILGWGLAAYITQLRLGLGVTGMNRPVYWGVYLTNFVFFIGISHAGTLISAILRVTQAEWRRPITRIAEAITVFALVVGALQIIVDMGRPERLLNVVLYGRFMSPILWDMVSITVYLLGSVTYLYLPLIPDMAMVRDSLGDDAPAWRKLLYRTLALGWHGGPEQRRRLERAIAIMAVLIISIAVSVHTVVSWIFGMTLQPMWHSTIFGPYFVVGAIFSGIATLFIAMTLMRRVFHLEEYITEKQYTYLGYLFLVMSAFWFYFTLAEYLTTYYGSLMEEMPVANTKLFGSFAWVFWTMVLFNFFVPFGVWIVPRILPTVLVRRSYPLLRPAGALAGAALVSAVTLRIQPHPVLLQLGAGNLPLISRAVTLLSLVVLAVVGLFYLKGRVVAQTVVAAIAVDIGMWLERYTIVVPSLTRPRLMEWAIYQPSWVEWSETLGSLALFALLFVLFFKLFPAVSIWEVQEGREKELEARRLSAGGEGQALHLHRV